MPRADPWVYTVPSEQAEKDRFEEFAVELGERDAVGGAEIDRDDGTRFRV